MGPRNDHPLQQKEIRHQEHHLSGTDRGRKPDIIKRMKQENTQSRKEAKRDIDEKSIIKQAYSDKSLEDILKSLDDFEFFPGDNLKQRPGKQGVEPAISAPQQFKEASPRQQTADSKREQPHIDELEHVRLQKKPERQIGQEDETKQQIARLIGSRDFPENREFYAMTPEQQAQELKRRQRMADQLEKIILPGKRPEQPPNQLGESEQQRIARLIGRSDIPENWEFYYKMTPQQQEQELDRRQEMANKLSNFIKKQPPETEKRITNGILKSIFGKKRK